jgi:hypothetical protein
MRNQTARYARRQERRAQKRRSTAHECVTLQCSCLGTRNVKRLYLHQDSHHKSLEWIHCRMQPHALSNTGTGKQSFLLQAYHMTKSSLFSEVWRKASSGQKCHHTTAAVNNLSRQWTQPCPLQERDLDLLGTSGCSICRRSPSPVFIMHDATHNMGLVGKMVRFPSFGGPAANHYWEVKLGPSTLDLHPRTLLLLPYLLLMVIVILRCEPRPLSERWTQVVPAEFYGYRWLVARTQTLRKLPVPRN